MQKLYKETLFPKRTTDMGFRSKRKREKMTYNYQCSLTAEEFVMTEKAPNPKELLTVKAFYEMNPDLDDRPAKKRRPRVPHSVQRQRASSGQRRDPQLQVAAT
jgi:hypothetical protein